ncbi:SMI1/KNR4 family protein [Xanthomonas fragariae]|uniref:SMI1 / KNR4 family protein n=2 Tax=Xanthomonas fragariae TaxID=48664 RepID=A0ABY1RSU5_9XANT|nr:SMI1/KNR4 family protein [Xanthomonas fragariae]WIY71829.1 SMI1/KNR4 family protein [Xanthomonas fragariae]SMQ96449.1 SMI1 / KNR4 family protein [Xanthomonas fragariae]SMR00353.1 SMI1 / KNR4 family protein [Xanthomonas fragariae]
MVIDVKNAVAEPSAECITSIEEYCGAKLPEDFKSFLSYGNGGIPHKQSFKAEGGDRIIERFLPLMDDPESDPANGQYEISVVETQIGERLASDPDQVGCNILPFATLFAGDFLCFDFRNDSDHPQVVIWDHNASEEFTPVTVPVASSFSELLEKLH